MSGICGGETDVMYESEMQAVKKTSVSEKPHISAHLVLQLLEHKGHWLAVEVSRRRGHGGVYVCVSINPDETQVRTLLGVASYRPDG